MSGKFFNQRLKPPLAQRILVVNRLHEVLDRRRGFSIRRVTGQFIQKTHALWNHFANCSQHPVKQPGASADRCEARQLFGIDEKHAHRPNWSLEKASGTRTLSTRNHQLAPFAILRV
jgi:hypothetical protein